MSLALQLIRAAIEAGSTSFVRDVRMEMLVEEEEPVYEFVRAHIGLHGQLPALETVTAAGFNLGRAPEPVSFYQQKVRERYAFNQINAHNPAYVAAMRTKDVSTVVAVLREMIAAVGHTLSPHQFTTLQTEATAVLEDYEYAKLHPGLRGITFGYPTMDSLTLGAMSGDLTVTAGRPSMGKSFCLLKTAHATWRAGYSCAFVSMEMVMIQIARRWVGVQTGINPNFIRAGQLNPWTEATLYHTVQDMQESPVPVHFMHGASRKGVEGLAKMIEETGCERLFVDAFYLMQGSARKKGYAAKWEEIASVTHETKDMAVHYGIPIDVTVQFGRGAKRLLSAEKTKELDLSDIGGSDAIPQDADIVDGIQYGPSPFQGTRREHTILKNREGATGKFHTSFRFTPMDFDEVEYEGGSSAELTAAPVNSQWML